MREAPFTTLAAPAEAEIRVRGSVFLALASPASGDAEARAVLAARERRHHDATHHCSAWQLREGVRRANDAGEPAGSAGAPILAAIEGAAATDVVVVVTRWFGGTRLGVGGLVRAYGEAAAAALAAAPRRTGIPCVRLRVEYAYQHTAAVMRAVELAGGEGVEHGYAAQGAAGTLELAVPHGAAAAFHEALREGTAGAVRPVETGEAVVYRNAARPSAY